MLGQIQGTVDESTPATLVSLRDCAEAYYYLHVNDIGKVPHWLTGNGRHSIDIPLDRGRDRMICASFKYAASDYVGAYSMLLELEEMFVEHRMWGLEINTSILMAACLFLMNNEKKAMKAFWNAYDMTWQNGVFTCFAEHGRTALMLLEAADKQNEYAFDHRWLSRAKKATQEYIKRETVMLRIYNSGKKTNARTSSTNLTAREKEILDYLAQGLTRSDIAGMLGITVNGVKKHITNIYNKLGAINRADAIYIAMASGVISPYEE
ncbi:MAG: response regulator transcription factor [Christensenellaceae bacterium]